MTVSYNLDVSSVSAWSFVRVILRWKGSIWKSIWGEFVIFIGLYYMIHGILAILFSQVPQWQITYYKFCDSYVEKVKSFIPLDFIPALIVSAVIIGDDAETVLARRSIVRYLVLSQVLVFRDISLRVRRRFPTLECVKEAGFIHANELALMNEKQLTYNKYWMPIKWAMQLATQMRARGKILSDPSFNTLINEIKAFRQHLAVATYHDWIPVPLAYPQVVMLAVRAYFFLALFIRQKADIMISFSSSESKNTTGFNYELPLPVLTCIQFVIYVSWIKVAEALLNPLGEDDDDLETNFLIDKNIAVSAEEATENYFETGMAIVDNTGEAAPLLLLDAFTPDRPPFYSEESRDHKTETALVGSVAAVKFVLLFVHKQMHYGMKESQMVPDDTLSQASDDFRRRTTKSWRLHSKASRPNSDRPRSYSLQPQIQPENLPFPSRTFQRPASPYIGVVNGAFAHEQLDEIEEKDEETVLGPWTTSLPGNNAKVKEDDCNDATHV